MPLRDCVATCKVNRTSNSGIWQRLQEGSSSGGFGLVQWTPATNYTNWAGANGYGITDPSGQLTWIDSVTVSFGQWIATDAYPLSFDQFKVSGKSPEYLASAFLKNFERAGVEVEARETAAGKILTFQLPESICWWL